MGRTFARSTSEAAVLDRFPSHSCSLLEPSPDHQPTESTATDTLRVSAPSRFQATQVYTPGGEREGFRGK